MFVRGGNGTPCDPRIKKAIQDGTAGIFTEWLRLSLATVDTLISGTEGSCIYREDLDKFRCRLGLSAVNLIEETAVPTCSATGFLTKRVAGLPTCVAIADADLSANVSLLGQTISFITPAEIVDECTGSQSVRRNAGDTAWECYTPSVGGVVTTSYPMPLSTISVSNANAFVDTIDGTNFDYSGVRFVDAVTGDTFWTFKIPPNLAATPAWNLIITHKAVSGAGGNVSLFVEC